MPELPEVETIVRGLRRVLPGRRVRTARLRHRSLYRRGSLTLGRLVGRRISGVERVGKNAVVYFEPKGLMLVNLGMTGQLMVCGAKDRPADAPAKHLHGRIGLDRGKELRYYDPRRFGHIYVAEACDFQNELNIGPDPFLIGEASLKAALRGRSASIKALLLDQRIISGIGNIYADETLFYAGIDPRAPGGKAARKAARLLDSARAVLTRAIEHGGSTLRDYRKHDGSRGEFQRYHAVYDKDGDACVECGATIRKIVLSGRGTHFCPKCQR